MLSLAENGTGGQVTFFQATGPRGDAIVNERLRFHCYRGLRGKAPGGPEEPAKQAQFDSQKGYGAALLSTRRRRCGLVAERRI